MTVRVATILCGMLLTSAASAADDFKMSGMSLKTDSASGVIECSGRCVLVFKSAKGMTIQAESMSTGQVAPGMVSLQTPGKARMVLDGFQYDVQNMTEFKSGADGTTTLKADKVRVSKVTSTL